jgi:undecaprenyl-diphosphatase
LQVIVGFFTLVGKLFSGKLKKEPFAYGEKLFLMLCIATVPLIPMVILADYVEAVNGISWLIGLLLIFNGFMLWLSDRLEQGKIQLENAGWLRPLLVGCIQLLGVFPGISRSGSTITGGRLCGFTREDAVQMRNRQGITGGSVVSMLSTWKNRKYIELYEGGVPTTDAGRQQYIKTQWYKEKQR